MTIIGTSKLFKIDYGVQGWTGIVDMNFKRLNTVLLSLTAIGDVQTAGELQNRDILVWNTDTSKWVVTHWADYFVTTTSTTTTSTTSSSTTTTLP